MLCDNCKKREASVMYEENINGKKGKFNLCAVCSNKFGILSHNFMDSMVFSFFEEPINIGYEKTKEEKCNKCGYSFSDYVKTGLLGCNECYNTFESKLIPIIKKIHGKECHVKAKKNINVSKENNDDNKTQINILKQELNNAIEKEEYEKAAVIRDKIKAFQERGDA